VGIGVVRQFLSVHTSTVRLWNPRLRRQ
jgi:hypothetical protein